jgi:hypothetical protein
MSYEFKFALGAQVVDKEVLDVRLIVGHVLDVDEGNKPMYLIVGPGSQLVAMGATLLEENFKDSAISP